jgi:hypothetical protein
MSNFQKIYNFYATLWRYFVGEFFDLKNSINRQINGDLEPLKGFEINFWVISPSDTFKNIPEND